MAFLALATVMYFSGNCLRLCGRRHPRAEERAVDLLLPMFVLGFLGFGVKAAILPFHDWLPAASPACPHARARQPAARGGGGQGGRVCGRPLPDRHYLLQPGSDAAAPWAQTVCLIVAMFSIVFGSAMAVRERHMKRRLAYSTMSNLSYVLLGALMLTPKGCRADCFTWCITPS